MNARCRRSLADLMSRKSLVNPLPYSGFPASQEPLFRHVCRRCSCLRPALVPGSYVHPPPKGRTACLPVPCARQVPTLRPPLCRSGALPLSYARLLSPGGQLPSRQSSQISRFFPASFSQCRCMHSLPGYLGGCGISADALTVSIVFLSHPRQDSNLQPPRP
jgi:hypothetical protein